MGTYWSNLVKSATPLHTGLISKNGHQDGNVLSWSYSKLSPASPRSEGDNTQSFTLKNFSFKELKTTTRNFHPDMGEGNFGVVFKGWIDEHTLKPTRPGTGMAIAVKKFKSILPDPDHQQLLAKIYYVGQLRHPNLARLIGYCLENKCWLLVYEFINRGSMEHHLFKRSGHIQSLSWTLRMRVALGAAKGLAFLHSDEIRAVYSTDLKTCNILLNEDYDAKLSDFGLCRIREFDDGNTVVVKVGTYAYLAPECLIRGCPTTKSDIHSFGVILLEILSGRRVIDPKQPRSEQTLLEWAEPYLRNKRKILRVVDPHMEGQYSIDHALKLANIVSRCLSIKPNMRPNINEVVKELETLQEFV